MLEKFFKPSNIDKNTKEVPIPKTHQQQFLPNQISGRILDLELQCEKQSVSKILVFELIQQYTKAVEFYQEQGNDKYKLYQKRMQNFLAKPMIQSILSGQSGQRVVKKERNQETIRIAEHKAEKQVKQLMEKQQQKQKKHQSFVKQELSRQEQVLEERIRKKRIMSNRSMKSQPQQSGTNNEESGKKQKQKQRMNVKLLLLNGINERSQKSKRVFL